MKKIIAMTLCILGTLSLNASAHCGSCEGDAKASAKKHLHKHDTALKAYSEGACCSAEHFAKKQKEAIEKKAKSEFKEGSCCSADHYASKKVKEAEKALKDAEEKK